MAKSILKKNLVDTPVDTPPTSNEMLKNLVSLGETFNPEWLDLTSADLLEVLKGVQEREENKALIGSLVLGKSLQNQQLISTLLYGAADAFGNKTQSWCVSLSKTVASAPFKTFINSNKNLEALKNFISTLK